MHSILSFIAKIVIKLIVKGLESDINRYSEEAEKSLHGEAMKVSKIVEKSAAKRAKLRRKADAEFAKEDAELAKERAAKREVRNITVNAQAKCDEAKAKLAKFKSISI